MQATRRETIALLVPLVSLVICGASCRGRVDAKSTSLETKRPTPGKGDVGINPRDGAKMVWIPAGEFMMGSTTGEVAALARKGVKLKNTWIEAEVPQHRVYLDGYWIYKYEVTVSQYRHFCDETGRDMPEPPGWGWQDDHPVVNATWQDAADYAAWAGAELPSEAEWEKAARGTDGRTYPWGNKWDASKCANSVEAALSGTKPVGSYPGGASPYGVLDMAGNAYEWCADWFDTRYYHTSPRRNPRGPDSDRSGVRVCRGDSWIDAERSAYGFRCANRDCGEPLTRRRYDFDGFRCVKRN